MSRLEKISIVASFVLAILLVTVFFAGLKGATKNDKLEGQNKTLQATNQQQQGEIVALQKRVKEAEQKSARLSKKVVRLEVNFWDQKSQISTLQNNIQDLRRGLPFWEANYDGMVAQNLGHPYRQWPFELREQLLGALGTMSQLGPDGHATAIQRFVALKPQVESAVQAGLGYGWEAQSLADFQATL